MTQASCNIELNIVDAASVRSYARNEVLPRRLREAVERTLLDDDRARDLVQRIASGPVVAISGRLGCFLLHAGEACCKAAHAYDLMSKRSDIAPSVRAFAQNRAASREFILTRINNLLQDCNEAQAVGGARPKRGTEAALQYAADCDEAFIAKLKRAFAAPSYPPIKARIAEWIAYTERDIGKFDWISPDA